jgi:hypothetical protein
MAAVRPEDIGNESCAPQKVKLLIIYEMSLDALENSALLDIS